MKAKGKYFHCPLLAACLLLHAGVGKFQISTLIVQWGWATAKFTDSAPGGCATVRLCGCGGFGGALAFVIVSLKCISDIFAKSLEAGPPFAPDSPLFYKYCMQTHLNIRFPGRVCVCWNQMRFSDVFSLCVLCSRRAQGCIRPKGIR